MKQVLFILLVFISFQGVAQKSVKIKEIGLEVMKTDLGKMKWDEANKACKKFRNGWRLPTIDELKKIYQYKDFIGGFEGKVCWSSTENDGSLAWFFHFNYVEANLTDKSNAIDVRAVRDLK